MVFTSINFLIFFPIVVLLTWLVPAKYRWFTLLIASYFFYFNVKPVFLLLVGGITISTYIFTWLISTSKDEKRKKIYLVANLIIILLPLFFFKYFSEINNGLIDLLGFWHLNWPLPVVKLILPVGISFYTFMAIGYTVDVYNEEIDFERNIGILGLFLSFFPLILSGPIERATNMLPQFKKMQSLNFDNLGKGLKMMLWGYFLKLVVADRIAIYVDMIFANIQHHNGSTLFVASILYPIQEYADFWGYSLIAMGVAKSVGLNIIKNFNRPFFATSISEFWRRWHISLISWLTDYIYTPLAFAFRNYKLGGVVIAIMVTFSLSGLWHGATLPFLVWGVLQGIVLSIEALLSKQRKQFEDKFRLKTNKIYILFCIAITYLIFAFSEVIGRSVDLSQAFTVFKKMLTQPGVPFLGDKDYLIFIILGTVLLFLKDFKDEFLPGKIQFFDNSRYIVRIASYSFVIVLILLIGVLNGGQFIYFQF